MDAATLLYALSALLILVGLAGTVLPALPGLPIVFAGMALAAWTGDFEAVSGWTVALLAVLALIAMGLDFVSGLLGARRVGASRRALLGAAVGTVVGLSLGFLGFIMGIAGLVLGPFVGAVLGELAHGRRAAAAMNVGLGTWMGMAMGAIAKLALTIVMLGVFVFALLI